MILKAYSFLLYRINLCKKVNYYIMQSKTYINLIRPQLKVVKFTLKNMLRFVLTHLGIEISSFKEKLYF